jgi:hypothetical protein
MPVGFLTEEHARYGHCRGEPLPRYWRATHVDDFDRGGSHAIAAGNRLGFAVQLCTVRFRGRLKISARFPRPFQSLARQLGIEQTVLPSTVPVSNAGNMRKDSPAVWLSAFLGSFCPVSSESLALRRVLDGDRSSRGIV